MSSSANIYMGAPVPLTTLANGAVTNAASHARLAKTSYLTPTADRVAPGVTCFGGDGFLNLSLIEAPDGLIVYDTGEYLGDGERFATQIKAISDKPVVAVIYSHSHYVHGTTALVGDGAGITIIGHPKVNENCATGGAGSLWPETAPVQSARTLQQFNHFTPASGPDAPAGAAIHFGRSGFLPVNRPVEDGERLIVAGLELQFFTRYGSDTDDCLTVYIPSTGVVLNNIVWPFMPNVYTLRAAKFRDPRDWRDALKVIRDRAPTALVNTHARAVVGAAKVAETLDNIIDGLSAVLDQTLRGILRGMGPDELRGFVKLPAHLAEFPNLAEIYGEISHFGPYLFNHALGWFDGDAGTINPVAPDEQAARLVDAMGGADAVLARARTAFVAREFAWAAQLVGYLQRLDQGSQDVRLLKADILREMGHITPAHTIRSWYLSQARALRGEVMIPHLQFSNTRTLALAPPAQSLDQFRVRIDPDKCTDLDIVVAITITDRGCRHGWHLRRGVVEFLDDPRTAALEISTDYDNWLRYFSCKRGPTEFLERVQINHGMPAAVAAFFAAFDYYAPEANSAIR